MLFVSYETLNMRSNKTQKKPAKNIISEIKNNIKHAKYVDFNLMLYIPLKDDSHTIFENHSIIIIEMTNIIVKYIIGDTADNLFQ
jgi:hypothetical protein